MGNRRSGFTLIELIVVIVIASALMGLIISYIRSGNVHSRNVVTKSRLMTVGNAIKSYYADNKVYPYSSQVTGVPEGRWVYQLQTSGENNPYIVNHRDFVRLSTDDSRTGMILDGFDNPLHFRVVGGPQNMGITINEYRERSNLLKTFYVWSRGEDGIDQFTSLYPQWEFDISNHVTFKIDMSSNDFDDKAPDDLVWPKN